MPGGRGCWCCSRIPKVLVPLALPRLSGGAACSSRMSPSTASSSSGPCNGETRLAVWALDPEEGKRCLGLWSPKSRANGSSSESSREGRGGGPAAAASPGLDIPPAGPASRDEARRHIPACTSPRACRLANLGCWIFAPVWPTWSPAGCPGALGGAGPSPVEAGATVEAVRLPRVTTQMPLGPSRGSLEMQLLDPTCITVRCR